MAQLNQVQVFGPGGLQGEMDSAEYTGSQRVTVHFGDGRAVSVPRELILPGDDGSYRLALREDQLDWLSTGEGTAYIIPVTAEELQVSRQKVETGRVRVHKEVSEQTQLVDEPIIQEEVQVERVPIGRVIHEPPPSRYEGDVLVIPLVEEVLHVEKRLVLREEVRISRLRTTERRPQQVTLRKEEVHVEREERPAGPDS